MSFKYIERFLTASYDDWPAMVVDLRKARSRWSQFYRLLRREGSKPPTSGTFYKAVVQETLLFGSETWVMSPRIGRNLSRFHHRVARRLEVMKPTRDMEGRLEYLPLGTAMAVVDINKVKKYVLRRQNTVAQYIIAFPILEICLEAERRTGAWVY